MIGWKPQVKSFQLAFKDYSDTTQYFLFKTAIKVYYPDYDYLLLMTFFFLLLVLLYISILVRADYHSMKYYFSFVLVLKIQ